MQNSHFLAELENKWRPCWLGSLITFAQQSNLQLLLPKRWIELELKWSKLFKPYPCLSIQLGCIWTPAVGSSLFRTCCTRSRGTAKCKQHYNMIQWCYQKNADFIISIEGSNPDTCIIFCYQIHYHHCKKIDLSFELLAMVFAIWHNGAV